MTPSVPVDTSIVYALTQTLLHFLWQGCALGACALCLLHAAGLRTPQARYAVYCGLLVLLAICPVATFSAISARRASATTIETNAYDGALVRRSTPLGATIAPASYSRWRIFPDEAAATAAMEAWMHRHRSSIVACWLGGIALFGARLIFAAIGVWMIARRRRPIPNQVSLIVERMARRIAFRARPLVFAVENHSQAVAVGLLRPMVLLPAAWICELPTDVLEAVLAHELAHVRRWDLPINFLQRLVETALFFHPVVWWCSRRLRIEREMCCDELALAVVGSRAGYARALTFLAGRRLSPSAMVLAAGIGGTKMVLLERIRNVLGLSAASHGRFYGPSCAAAGAALASIAWLVGLGGFRGESSEEVPPQRIALRAPAPYRGAGQQFRLGKANSSAVGVVGQNVPSEKAKRLLPSYTIEPPDVLLIEAARVVPKAPYRIQSPDVLSIALGGRVEAPHDGSETRDVGGPPRSYAIDSDGRIDLGLYLGKVQVSGLTQDEAGEAVAAKLQSLGNETRVSLQVQHSSALQPITGEHLVSPDGTVNLGTYGQVSVAGLTVEKAKAAIEEKLAAVLDHPQVIVNVFAFNSKVYYVIVEGADSTETVARLPITGSETVLDALAQVNGLDRLASKNIWIARPAPGRAGGDTILPVDWTEITKGADTSLNYQVLPGDRVFVME